MQFLAGIPSTARPHAWERKYYVPKNPQSQTPPHPPWMPAGLFDGCHYTHIKVFVQARISECVAIVKAQMKWGMQYEIVNLFRFVVTLTYN